MQTHTHTHTHTHMQTHIHTHTYADTDRQKNTETHRRTNIQTHRYTQTPKHHCTFRFGSNKARGTMPSKQPRLMPRMLADAITRRLWGSTSCSGVSPDSGMPIRLAMASIVLLRPRPTTSEARFPKPAAAMVERCSDAPMAESILSPAIIMMKLSANPNPIMGTACLNPSTASWKQ